MGGWYCCRRNKPRIDTELNEENELKSLAEVGGKGREGGGEGENEEYVYNSVSVLVIGCK